MYFEFESFAGHPVRHAMSQRRRDAPSEGDVGYARDTIPEHIETNRNAFLAGAGFDNHSLTLGRQVHGERVSIVRSVDRGRGQPPDFDAIPDSDGLISNSNDLTIGVIVADCVPILLYDPVKHALGVVHAGWRGTVTRIVANAVEKLAQEFGSEPANLLAGIGPSIGPCCYEVGPEVIDAWSAVQMDGRECAVVEGAPRAHFDLWTANRLLLLQAGLVDARIEVASVCTKCDTQRYFSHRAAMAGERPRGRMIMVAQLT